MMTDLTDKLTKRCEEMTAEIAVLVDRDVQSVLAGKHAGNCLEVVTLTQEVNILSAAIERLRNSAA